MWSFTPQMIAELALIGAPFLFGVVLLIRNARKDRSGRVSRMARKSAIIYICALLAVLLVVFVVAGK